MLIVGSALKGYATEGIDGYVGTVNTFLFEDTTWKIRWLVINTRQWLPGRQVLVHPSAIGVPAHPQQMMPVNLTTAQVQASPDIAQDQPVTMQTQDHLYSYYGSDPYWGADLYKAGQSPGLRSDTFQPGSKDGDPHLHSMKSVSGYYIQAIDGSLGHVEGFIVDDESWTIRSLIVDTRNWWSGDHVLISPSAVKSINWGKHEVCLTVRRDQVKSSPSWEPAQVIDQINEVRPRL